MGMSAPTSVHLVLTHSCNLRCKHCFASSGPRLANELDKNEWLEVIRILAHAKVFNLVVSGGEIFTKEGIFDVLMEINKYPFAYSVNTNATLVTEQIAKRLANLPRKPPISVSFDGSCPETLDALRGEGTFEKVIRGIRKLLEANLSVGVFTVITKYNVKDISNMVKLAQQLGVEQLKLNSCVLTGRALVYADELLLSLSQRRQVGVEAFALSEEYPGFVGGTFVGWSKMFRAFQENPPKPGDKVRTLGSCGAATGHCAIGPDGWVSPCEQILQMKAGNIRDEDFVSIWRSSKLFQEIRGYKNVNLDDIPGCQDCRCSPNSTLK